MDRCLTGVYGAVPPEWAPKLVDVMSEELISLSRSISDVELDRAKNAAIGQVPPLIISIKWPLPLSPDFDDA